MVRTSGVATQGNKDTAYRNASREAKPDILKIHVPIWTGRKNNNLRHDTVVSKTKKNTKITFVGLVQFRCGCARPNALRVGSNKGSCRWEQLSSRLKFLASPLLFASRYILSGLLSYFPCKKKREKKN